MAAMHFWLPFALQVDEEKRARFKARKEQEVRLPGSCASVAGWEARCPAYD